ncbi:MAG: hypothetical protein WC761_07175 [Candidatus Paceibacterota bacterium]|jgi:hypothetical protein
MPKRPTIVTLAAAMLIISATFSSRASASTGGATPSFGAITITEKESGQQKTGKRKKEFQGAGTVTAVSGSIVTVLGNDQTLYVVDAGHAAVKKGTSAQASLADIRSGDKLFVRGEVTGSEETSSEIFE